MQRPSPWVMAIVTILVLAGCDDDPETDCNYVLDPCDSFGDVQCSDDGRAIEECIQNSDGCLRWDDGDLCDDFETCSDVGGEPACSCADACDSEGDTQCAGEIVQICSTDRDGCMYWDDDEDCSESALSCIETDGTAQCSTCTNECETEGDVQCVGEVISTCDVSDSGCLGWVAGTDCSSLVPPQTCDDSGDEVVCSDECTDRCPASGDVQCVGEVISTCEVTDNGCLDWVAGTDCSSLDPSQFCDDSGDEVVCSDECTDRCPDVDDTQCVGEVIMTCDVIDSGCLDWVAGTDCSSLDPPTTCDDSSGEALCVGSCVDVCLTADEQRCSAGVVETCETTVDGCLDWIVDEDCTELDPTSICIEEDAVASCAPVASSESCEDALTITTPLFVSGEDFNADFGNEQALRGLGCSFFAESPEAVFALDLVAGDKLRVREYGAMDAVLSIQETCGDTSSCTISSNWELYYIAHDDMRVYVIIEGSDDWWFDWGYDIQIEIARPEICDNELDDDFDWNTDCYDDDCIGISPCDTEIRCDNWFDDDGDGLMDCVDPDCDADEFCLPESDCDDNIDNDDDGMRDCDDYGCWGEPPCDVETHCSDWWDNDGDGMMDCADPDCDADEFCLPESDCGDGDDNDGDYWFDCDDPGCMGDPPCDSETNCYDGWDNDLDGARDCDDTECATEPHCVLETNCGDGEDNEGDGSIDCEDWDCFGVPPCDVETICDDYNDNDRDMLTDCEDPDCSTICVPETECGDGVDNDGDWWRDCDDRDCFGVPPCNVETNCFDDRDNDLDGYHDCDDTDCATVLDCIREVECGDGEDNDGNGWTDCADRDCFGMPPCDVETICDDYNDNDRDDLWDCADPDCEGHLHCIPESDCGDGEDNDTDYYTDCQDPDCFGTDPFCTTETFCFDWWDNDDDGLMDCEDPDCESSPDCS